MGDGMQGVAAVPGRDPAPITSDVAEFAGKLLPGDVLLFDTIHPLSGAIQFAESRPINHCALFLGNDEIAQVTRNDPAAWTLKLSERLDPLFDRTVTALRHKDSGAEGAKEVVTRAKAYVDGQDTSYAYLSLLTLSVPGIFRSYGRYLDDGGPTTRSFGALMEALSKALVTTFEPAAEGADQDPVQRKPTLTCSEFVYRSYLEASPSRMIEVEHPLFSLGEAPGPAAVGAPGPPQPGIAGVNRGAGTGDYGLKMHPSLAAACALTDPGPGVPVRDADAEWSRLGEFWGLARTSRGPFGGGVVDEVTVTPGVPIPAFSDEFQAFSFSDRGGLGGWSTAKTLARAGLTTIWNLVAHNGGLGKYGKFLPGAGYEVLADTVTPKDLWSSPSLNAVAVLHRPPNHEPDLDEVHH